MMYKGDAPDNRELVYVNMADKEHPQKILHLVDSQFICFVGHNFADREAKIGFLAMEEDYVKLCWLVCVQPFEKKKFNGYEDFRIESTIIDFRVPILHHIQSIRKVEFIRLEGYRNADVEGALIVQTDTDIWFSNNLTGAFQKMTTQDESVMVPLYLHRGYNNFFYFVQSENAGSDQILIEVSVDYVGSEWKFYKSSIFKVNEGQIAAFELDPESLQFDSMYSYERDLYERNSEVMNKLYVVSSSADLHVLVQTSEVGQKYTEVEKRNLQELVGFSDQLANFREKPFNSMSISDRCITLNDTNYNFFNSHSWAINISNQRIKGSQLEEVDSDDDSEESEEEANDKKKVIRYKIHSIQNLQWTKRQILIVSLQEKDEET